MEANNLHKTLHVLAGAALVGAFVLAFPYYKLGDMFGITGEPKGTP